MFFLRLFICITATHLLVSQASAIDPAEDPFPPDPRLALREYFRTRLPPVWWANEPEYNLQTFTVQVNIPDSWRGNPTSAAMSLCPDPGHALWRTVKQFEIRPFYRMRNWAGVVCRP